MARCVFTSFHYQRDIFRVNVVRNSYLCKGGYNVAGYWDHSLWERTKSQGEGALKRLIHSGLEGTTVTAVLAGAETAGRYWVQYELIESWRRGNGILCIYINGIQTLGFADVRGPNPLDSVWWTNGLLFGQQKFSTVYPTYDWVTDDGYNNYGRWIEAAATAAGK